MDCLERREFFHEGKITLPQECEKILSSFQTGKTPGNDGLLIEFYKTFWPLIGKLMTDSFNEAFDKKEMSSSQKQAIITLIAVKERKGQKLFRKLESYIVNKCG